MRDPTISGLGEAVRHIRHRRELTIEGLAFQADIHPTYLSGIERGGRNPTYVVLRSLARALEIPLAQLIVQAEDLEGLDERVDDKLKGLRAA